MESGDENSLKIEADRLGIARQYFSAVIPNWVPASIYATFQVNQ